MRPEVGRFRSAQRAYHGAMVRIAVVLVLAAAAGAQDLAARLQKGDFADRNRVLDELLRADAAVAVPLLTGVFAFDESFLRRRAAQALGEFGAAAAPAVPVLTQALFDEHHDVRVQAATALHRIGDAARPAAIYLQDAGRDQVDPDLGVTMPTLAPGIAPSPLPAWMGGLGYDRPPGFARLLEALEQDDVALRLAAVEAMARVRRAPATAEPALRDRLADEDWRVRGRAAEGLGVVGAKDPSTRRALFRAVADKSSLFVRRKAAFALARLDASGELALALGHDDVRVRRMAAHALAHVTAPPPKPLAAALATPDRTLRVHALAALRRAGKKAAPATDALAAVLESDDAELVGAAVAVLAGIGPEAAAAVPALAARIDDPRLGETAAWALASIGPRAAAAVPALRARLLDATRHRGAGVALALARLGEPGRGVLVAAAESENAWARLHAVVALGNLADVPVAALERAADDPSPEVRTAARRILARVPTAAARNLEELLAKIERMPALPPVAAVGPRLAQVADGAVLAVLLADPSLKTRYAAVHACRHADLGDARADVVEALGMLVRRDDDDVRAASGAVLAELAGSKALDALLAGASSAGPRAGRALAVVIAGLGPPVVVRLAAALPGADKPTTEVCLRALEALSAKAAPAVPAMVARLADSDGYTERLVRRAIGAVGAAAVPGLLAGLHDPDPKVRATVAGLLKPHVGALAPHLPAARKDRDATYRFAIVRVLIEAEGREAELVRWIHDTDPRIRLEVIGALGRAQASEGLTALLRALRDAAPEVRQHAVVAVGHFADATERVAPALAALVNDPAKTVREAVPLAIARLGPAAADAMRAALAAKYVEVRLAAVKALELWKKGRVELLGPLLDDGDQRIRIAAVRSMRNAPAALALLRRALSDRDRTVRREAVAALGTLRQDADGAARALVPLLRVRRLKSYATRALVALGPGGATAVVDALPVSVPTDLERVLSGWGAAAAPALRALLKDRSALRRRGAAWALGHLAAKDAVDDLVRALADGDTYVKSQAAWALGRIGPDAKAALPSLRALARDETLAPVAKDAIGRIEAKGKK